MRSDLEKIIRVKTYITGSLKTDHRPFSLQLKGRSGIPHDPPKRQSPRRKLVPINQLLKNPSIATRLRDEIKGKLDHISMAAGSIDEADAALTDIMTSAIKSCRRGSDASQPDWFLSCRDTLQPLIDSARELKAHDKNDATAVARFKEAKALLQKAIRKAKESWISAEIESSGRNYWKAVKTFREYSGGSAVKPKPFSDRQWADYLCSLFAGDLAVDVSAALETVPQYDLMPDLDVPPSLDEVVETISSLSRNKSGGKSGVTSDVLKDGGPELHAAIHELLVRCWSVGYVPRSWSDGTFSMLPKRGKDLKQMKSWRSICLLEASGKVAAKLVSNRLQKVIEVICLDQLAYRKGLGTADGTQSLRSLVEKAVEHSADSYFLCADVSRAFDNMNRELCWSLLTRFGVPPKMCSLIKSMHENQMATIGQSPAFSVKQGARQGCCLGPSLFSIYLAGALVSFRSARNGTGIRYLSDPDLDLDALKITQRNLTIEEFLLILYADDILVGSESIENLTASCEQLNRSLRLFGLSLDPAKSVFLAAGIPAANLPDYLDTDLGRIARSDSVVYLGSKVSADNDCLADVEARVAKANSVLGALRRSVIADRSTPRWLRYEVVRATVLQSLLFGLETAPTTVEALSKLDVCWNAALRFAYGTSIPQMRITHLSDDDIRSTLRTRKASEFLNIRLLGWVGHLARHPKSIAAKTSFSCRESKRGDGRPLQGWRHSAKTAVEKLVAAAKLRNDAGGALTAAESARGSRKRLAHQRRWQNLAKDKLWWNGAARQL